MVKSIHIENFKSIYSLDIELGRLNVFIGANGSGKSNILEAIAMGSAAMEDKLDDEFLVNRGIRITEADLMRSKFDKNSQHIPISIFLSAKKVGVDIKLTTLAGHYNRWRREVKFIENEEAFKAEKDHFKIDDIKDYLIPKDTIKYISKDDDIYSLMVEKFTNTVKEKGMHGLLMHLSNIVQFKELSFFNFIIYAPENHFLRRFEEESSIKPLGIKGEGLFKLISIIAQEYPDQFNEIKKHLKLIDWFEDLEIPGDLKFTEKRIKIKDQYLDADLQYFDQRSANEGFLYLLFYLTLFISNETPHFFAIDNIDNSLNPKLGSKLIEILAQLAKDHNKQAILTTHNPVILDGLDLEDDDQRLFVVYRNADGHTKVRRISSPKQLNGVAPVRLSEAFTRGYIGGIPDNF